MNVTQLKRALAAYKGAVQIVDHKGNPVTAIIHTPPGSIEHDDGSYSVAPATIQLVATKN